MGDLVRGPWSRIIRVNDADYRIARDAHLTKHPCLHTNVRRVREHVLCEACHFYVEDVLL